MKTLRYVCGSALLAAATIFVSCTDGSPVAPASQSSAINADLLTLTRTVVNSALLTCSSLPAATSSKVIGPEGGTITVGPATFTVPEGALKERVRITASAPSGNVNHVDFQPEGLTFKKPASLTMSYANCIGIGSLLPKHIAYTSDNLQTIFYFLDGVDDLVNNKVTARVEHFSDYVMAW